MTTKITTIVPRREKPDVDTQEGALAWLTEQCERARRDGPFSEVGELTPALAKVLVELNPDNRTIRRNLVRAIREDAKAGRYLLNGETIIISCDGVVNDGQHRCLGIIEAGVPVQTFFAFGVSRDSRTTVDTGGAKTSGDHMTMSGIGDGNVVAAVTALLAQYERTGTLSIGESSRATKAEVRQRFLAGRQEIERAVALTTENLKSVSLVFGSRSLAAFFLIVASRRNVGAAREFYARLRDGQGLQAGDPVLIARERLMAEKATKLRTMPVRFEMVLRAWNMFREGKTHVRSIPIIGNLPPML
jgi:hypothetical protein